MQTDLVNTLKRLGIIKTCISLDDEELIQSQVEKLKELNVSEEVKNILVLIETGEYSLVIREIDKYILSKNKLVPYEDGEISGLKKELKVLEVQLQILYDERDGYLHLIDEFNNKYNSELGSLINDVLKRKKQDAKIYSETEISEESNDAYEQAKVDYEEFQNHYNEEIENNIKNLDDNEKKELKKLYREASAMCHPDRVTDDFKDQATAIFQDLSKAYKLNDIETVNLILKNLKDGNGFVSASNSILEKDELVSWIKNIREKIQKTTLEIDKILIDEHFIFINNLDDWNDYFLITKSELEEQLDR